MKKLIFIFCLLLVSSIIYCQNRIDKYTMIKYQVDSLVKKYDVKEINIVFDEGLQLKPPLTDFYIDNGFLVVNKMSYYNLDKLVVFHVVKDFWKPKYSIQFIFN